MRIGLTMSLFACGFFLWAFDRCLGSLFGYPLAGRDISLVGLYSAFFTAVIRWGCRALQEIFRMQLSYSVNNGDFLGGW